ncbi:MAG: universal stress protein [Burkholderiaceae bacterium]
MKILLPLDGSEPALEAVRHAVRLVREGLRADFVLANVQEPTFLYEMVLAPDAEVLERARGAAAAHSLEAGEALLKAAAIAYERETGSGDPAHTLVEIVERFGCDAVIMGARGMGRLRRAMLGSVSHEMLHAAPVPVTIVKMQSAAPAVPGNERDDAALA